MYKSLQITFTSSCFHLSHRNIDKASTVSSTWSIVSVSFSIYYFGSLAGIFNTFVESIAFTWLCERPDLRFYVVFANNNEPIKVWLFNNTYEFRSLYIPMAWLVTKCLIPCKHNSYYVYLPRWVCGVWSIQMPSFYKSKFHLPVTLMYIYSLCLLHNSPYDHQNCSSFNETVRSIYTTQADTKMQHP